MRPAPAQDLTSGSEQSAQQLIASHASTILDSGCRAHRRERLTAPSTERPRSRKLSKSARHSICAACPPAGVPLGRPPVDQRHRRSPPGAARLRDPMPRLKRSRSVIWTRLRNSYLLHIMPDSRDQVRHSTSTNQCGLLRRQAHDSPWMRWSLDFSRRTPRRSVQRTRSESERR